ncbi:MAG: DCC1-like thiol-disulfide oxidoreductase family protein [Actinomycetota bacterium]|jgi:predicted DCC family thiol-disulfide oxidoreductase YuxK|nr:DCC1-like thiol-disulfide oxidoreductase family protein [Actinomycetota bacterium]
MHDGPTASPRFESPTALLIFDGDCGFCTTAADWAQRHFRHGEHVRAWQLLGDDGLEELRLNRRDVEAAAWWVDGDGKRERGHRAVGRAFDAFGGKWRIIGWLVLVPPSSWFAAASYRLVVRWRYRLPGGTPACRVDTTSACSDGKSADSDGKSADLDE